MPKPGALPIVRGLDDYTPESRRMLEIIVGGDLAAYDARYFGSPEWIAFWRIHGEHLMVLVVDLIKRYEDGRAAVARG